MFRQTYAGIREIKMKMEEGCRHICMVMRTSMGTVPYVKHGQRQPETGSEFQTLFLPQRFIKIRPSHQQPVSIEFLTICRIPEFPKSEQNRKSCGNVRI